MFEGLKSTIGRLGNKVANIAAGGLKLGQKAVGTVSHYGHKFVDPIQHGLDSVSKIPFVGKMVAPVLAPVAGVVGTASSALQVLDGASGMMGRGAKGIRGAQKAFNHGDRHSAANVMRDVVKDQFASGRALRSSAKSLLEKKGR